MLVIFDVEGVLLNAEYLPVLARLLGPQKEAEIWDITNKGIRGEINWEEGLKERVHALRGIQYDDANKIAQNLEIMPGAKELCSFLKSHGARLVAVSGGFNIITDRLHTELNIDKIFSNDLVFNNGKLDDVVIHVTSDKSASVRKYVEENGFSPEETVVIVDGANDLKLFNLSSFTIGFCPVDVIRNKANVTIDEKDLSLVIPIIKEKFKIRVNPP